MEAVARLHTLPGVVLVGALAALGVAAAIPWLRRREPAAWVDAVRRALLLVVVVEAALGLALALRGAGPAEWIHWLYGLVIIVALLLPAVVRTPDGRTRSALLAGGAAVGAVMAWRLMGSG